MRLGWLSDIHLNFLRQEQLQVFLHKLSSTEVDAWLITGDIAEAPTLARHLQVLSDGVSVPIYFVLGNHDFYRGSFTAVGIKVASVCSAQLQWLTNTGPLLLSRNLALVGDDGWGDAILGIPEISEVVLNDFNLIQELTDLSKQERIAACRALGHKAAARIRPKLKEAADSARQILVLTHVPPFRGATWHEGRISGDDWLPWFSCKAMGDVILSCAIANPACRVTVLCGHTHGGGTYQAASNVCVYTAEAEYGAPRIQELFEV